MSNVEWLLRDAADERALNISERAEIDDERWRATIERIEIGVGLRVFLTDAQARRDITVEARDKRTDRWLGSQVTLAGGADIDFLDGARLRAGTKQAMLFRPSGRRAAYSIAAGSRFHSAGWGLDIDRAARLFDGSVPPALRPLLACKIDASQVVAMPADRRIRQAARSLFSGRLNGPLRALMLEGVVLQLLALQAGAAQAGSCGSRKPLSACERSAIQEARERLLADMRQPPSLGALAAAVGLSEKQLNAGFRALFGATVFETLKNERLEHARLAFETTTDLTLKEVAFRVGYNHVSNFVSAFTSRYGSPPRQYLRLCRAADRRRTTAV